MPKPESGKPCPCELKLRPGQLISKINCTCKEGHATDSDGKTIGIECDCVIKGYMGEGEIEIKTRGITLKAEKVW